MARNVTNMDLVASKDRGARIERPEQTMRIPELVRFMEHLQQMKSDQQAAHDKAIAQKLAKMDEVIKAIQAIKTPAAAKAQDLKPLVKAITEMRQEAADPHKSCSYKVTGKRDQRGLIDLEHGLIFTAVE